MRSSDSFPFSIKWDVLFGVVFPLPLLNTTAPYAQTPCVKSEVYTAVVRTALTGHVSMQGHRCHPLAAWGPVLRSVLLLYLELHRICYHSIQL